MNNHRWSYNHVNMTRVLGFFPKYFSFWFIHRFVSFITSSAEMRTFVRFANSKLKVRFDFYKVLIHLDMNIDTLLNSKKNLFHFIRSVDFFPFEFIIVQIKNESYQHIDEWLELNKIWFLFFPLETNNSMITNQRTIIEL